MKIKSEDKESISTFNNGDLSQIRICLIILREAMP